MNILFTICGRAGSKGFENKNLKEIHGVPLVYYTLSSIKLFIERHGEDNVTVALNTDSKPLVEIVLNQFLLEDIVYAQRKENLAGDKVAKVDVIKDTYLSVKGKKPDIAIDVIVDLDLTSPMRAVSDIENCIEEFKSGEYDLVTTVVPSRRSPYFNMIEKRGNYYQKICKSDYTARQQAPECYELNASIYAYRPEFLESDITKTILDYRCGVSVMKDYLVLDIDSEENFRMMEFLHRYYCDTDEGIRDVYEMAEKASALS